MDMTAHHIYGSVTGVDNERLTSCIFITVYGASQVLESSTKYCGFCRFNLNGEKFE